MLLALQEIRRSVGRFTLLTLAVALLVFLLLFFQSVAGALTSGLTGAYEQTTADVLVYNDRARLNPFASFLDPSIVNQVSAVDGVDVAEPLGFVIVTGETAEGEQIPMTVWGGGTETAGQPANVFDGRRPEVNGEALAADATFERPYAVGDVVTVDGVELRIVGEAKNAPFNLTPTLYVPFDQYADVVAAERQLPPGTPVPPALIAVSTQNDPASVAAAINETIEGVEAVTISQALDGLPGVDQISRSFAILTILLYVVVTIVTAVFFLILTVQKRDALVLLRAIGATTTDVVVPLLFQVFFVAGFGALLGVAAGAGMLYATQEVFGSTLSPTIAVRTVAAIISLGVLSSLWAISRVLKADPLDATTGGHA